MISRSRSVAAAAASRSSRTDACCRASRPGSERYFAGPSVFLTKKIETGGRILRYPYTGTSPSVYVQVNCGEPAYAFMWLNGRLEAQGLCGIQSDHIDHLLSWVDQSGRHLRGRNEVGVAVVPAARMTADRDAGDPAPALGEQEAERVIGETGEYRTSARVTVREAGFAVVMPSPACDRDIVIRKPNGQEILSSACDRPTGFPLPGD